MATLAHQRRRRQSPHLDRALQHLAALVGVDQAGHGGVEADQRPQRTIQVRFEQPERVLQEADRALAGIGVALLQPGPEERDRAPFQQALLGELP